MANYVQLSGSITLSQAVPTGSNTVIGRCYTEDLPLVISYFSFLVPDGKNYLASIGTDGNVTIYNYTGVSIASGLQLYAVGWTWIF